MTRAIPLFATLLAGCAAYEDRLPVAQPDQITAIVSRTLHGDTRCPEHARIAFAAALGTYASVTDGRARLQVRWDLDNASLMTLSTEPIVLCVDTLPPHAGGKTDGDVIKLAPLACPDEYACALHEIGHYLGMQHLEHGHGVMAERNPSRSFSDADFVELFRLGLYAPHRRPDFTTVTLTIDPSIPRIEPEYPHE